MPKLILEKFQCVEETDEIGSDNPYFFTFVGQRSNFNTTLVTTQLAFWKNEVDSGDMIPVNVAITSAFNLNPADTLMICGMVEQDNGRDVTGAKVVSIRESMDNLFKVYVTGTAVPFTDPQFRRQMRDNLEGWIEKEIKKSSKGDEDDVMEAALVSVGNSAGLFDPVTLRGHDGKYKVWYRRVDP
jgi:hypothetical protein